MSADQESLLKYARPRGRESSSTTTAPAITCRCGRSCCPRVPWSPSSRTPSLAEANERLKRSMVDGFLTLASQVPVLAVTVPDGLPLLNRTLDAVERGVESTIR